MTKCTYCNLIIIAGNVPRGTLVIYYCLLLNDFYYATANQFLKLPFFCIYNLLNKIATEIHVLTITFN